MDSDASRALEIWPGQAARKPSDRVFLLDAAAVVLDVVGVKIDAAEWEKFLLRLLAGSHM